jgi:nucleoside-diphosphate-sugar epimerase
LILVTGASGFIGRHLCRRLLEEGLPVRALMRSEMSARSLPDGAQAVAGDLTDRATLSGVGNGVTTVYHLAGPYRGQAEALEAVHVGGTRNLLGVLDAEARVIVLSSTSVYGWDQRWPADETTPPRPSSAYGAAKLRAEELVLARGAGRGVVARSTIVYGPGDRHGMIPRSLQQLRRGLRWFPGDGSNRIHLLHVEDLVDGLVCLREQGQGVYLFAGPTAVPISDVLSMLAEAAGTPPPRFGLAPAGLLNAAAAANDVLARALGWKGDGPISRHSLDVATRDRCYSPTRAPAELGWSPRIQLTQGLRDLVAADPREGSSLPARPSALGFDWRNYVDDEDEGLGTVYERFMLDDLLRHVVERTGATSVLHAPAFGMMGAPGLDAVMLARRGIRVGIADFDKERVEMAVELWRELGLHPEVTVLPEEAPDTWPLELESEYDLCFSFAALWWFTDPAAVIAAQARWSRKAVLVCTPNRNVFMWLRGHLWQRRLFDEELNPSGVDPEVIRQGAARAGMREVGSGLFDMPPFPDTSVPLAKLLRARLPARGAAERSTAAWSWSILPFLRGSQPELDERVRRIGFLEGRLPGPAARAWAHHRWLLFEHEPRPASLGV